KTVQPEGVRRANTLRWSPSLLKILFASLLPRAMNDGSHARDGDSLPAIRSPPLSVNIDMSFEVVIVDASQDERARPPVLPTRRESPHVSIERDRGEPSGLHDSRSGFIVVVGHHDKSVVDAFDAVETAVQPRPGFMLEELAPYANDVCFVVSESMGVSRMI